MKVEMKKVDIKRGQVCNPYACPVALAIYRAVSGTHDVKVLSATVQVRGNTYKLPQLVTDFINRFDDSTTKKRRELKPFTFTIRGLGRGEKGGVERCGG